jgi:hypothetical protein
MLSQVSGFSIIPRILPLLIQLSTLTKNQFTRTSTTVYIEEAGPEMLDGDLPIDRTRFILKDARD